MRSWRSIPLVLALTTGCEDDDDRNPPPAGSGNPGGVSAGAGTSNSTEGTGGASSGGSNPGGSSSTGSPTGTSGGPFSVLTGRFLDGGGGFALPITCLVQFHFPGQIEPSTGNATAVAFSRPFEIDAFPQSFSIESTDVPGLVQPGDTGFVTASCDVDDDNFFDDNVGGYYPMLPLVEVTVPASSIDLPIEYL